MKNLLKTSRLSFSSFLFLPFFLLIFLHLLLHLLLLNYAFFVREPFFGRNNPIMVIIDIGLFVMLLCPSLLSDLSFCNAINLQMHLSIQRSNNHQVEILRKVPNPYCYPLCYCYNNSNFSIFLSNFHSFHD